MIDITWSLFIQAISFCIFFLIFRRVFFTPILKNIERRERDITSLLEEAEDRRERAVEIEERCTTRLQEAREEASRIVSEGERNAQRKYDEILAAARREGDQILSEARKAIETDKARALAEFEDEAAQLASEIAGRVLGRELDASERDDLETVVVQMVRGKAE